MTDEQKAEWAERKALARDFARGAVVWATRHGMTVEQARREIAETIKDAA